ncbi:DNA/RNA non-specific endonuclease [Aquibium sp. ELW1220]|uniref:DNA/RNA non-specific endonuclease n=1 Tax=Aquibium sp. ELW1220 TaxID=2976766 RepID=UPI0025B029BA|nr:DNA/RNA non-specific endonuclease [Aquibium sp. ELW1220]MDN2584292.1 DNA/RNA non-specific endonuclease [Aquibium sp. ELW1220]
MSEDYAENVRRLGQFGQSEREAAARALEEGHPLLEEARLQRAVSSEALDAGPAQLENLGSGSAMLEAIVRIVNRPPMSVVNGAVKLVDLPRDVFPADFDVKVKRIEPMLGSVGRIEFVNHDMDWGGTGWVIDRDGDSGFLVVTNRHVAQHIARRTHSGGGAFLFAPGGAGRYGAGIDFNEEVDAPADLARLAPLLGFTYIADDTAADVAIARIAAPETFSIDRLPLAETDGRNDELIAVVGYPARDSRNDATHMERYFQGLYDVKRFSPGFLKVSSAATRLSHDATTLGGNSGSPVISLERGEVVGLHFAGLYAVGNSAVRVSTLRRILDGERTVVPSAGIPQEDAEARDGESGAFDFAGRDGYDPRFLEAFEVPLPNAGGVAGVTLARPSDASDERPHELRYTHFGILYCARNRSPVVAAANLDGERAVRFKRTADRWYYDLRIDRALQVGSEIYSQAGVDRGHMVRREDPNWGDADTVRLANFDTFHFTNCSPQHGRFNRNLTTWRGLEDYILDNSRTHGFRACVFTGPILGDGVDAVEELGLVLPREYWKLVVMPARADGGGLVPHATAYLLSQGELIQKLLQDRGFTEAVEGFVFGAYRTFQIPIALLEKETGFDFGALRDHDAFVAGTEGTEAVRPYAAIDDLGDVIL